MPIIKPGLKNVIVKMATSLKNHRANADSLLQSMHKNSSFKGLIYSDMQAVATLIMVQASRDADEDLKKMVLSMRNHARANKSPAQHPTVCDQPDQKQLMLQIIMLRKSEIAEEVGIVIRRFSDNRDHIIDNLK